MDVRLCRRIHCNYVLLQQRGTADAALWFRIYSYTWPYDAVWHSTTQHLTWWRLQLNAPQAQSRTQLVDERSSLQLSDWTPHTCCGLRLHGHHAYSDLDATPLRSRHNKRNTAFIIGSSWDNKTWHKKDIPP